MTIFDDKLLVILYDIIDCTTWLLFWNVISVCI